MEVWTVDVFGIEDVVQFIASETVEMGIVGIQFSRNSHSMRTPVRLKQTATDRAVHGILATSLNAVSVKVPLFISLFRLELFALGARKGTFNHPWQTAITQIHGKVAITSRKLCDVRL